MSRSSCCSWRRHGLVEPRILNRDRHLRRHGGEHALVLFIEEAGARVFQVQHADDAPLVKQRDDQLRPRLGIHLQVARILAHIGNVDRRATRAPRPPPARCVMGIRRSGACA